ncbi:MAG: hypothetical protein K8R87_01140 [Verrucomicrobia bacterium]|nr:hypothetical protein [Verrucomicrobiota bacterium]
MIKLSLLLTLSLLCSCVGKVKYAATAPNGGTEVMEVWGLFGGSEAFETAGGTRWTGNRNKSFGQGAQAVTTIAGGIAYGKAVNSNNLAKTNAAIQQTAQQKNAAAAATEQARIAAEQATTETAIKAGAEVAPIVVTPP